MSKVLTDQIEKRTGGTAIDLPTSGKWPTANIADDAITADKLANSINTDIAANTAKVTNATHTGDVTGATALTIADNVVSLAKMAGITRASIIVGDASGDPSALVKGTSEQVLRVNTAGTDLEYADAVGGAAWVIKTAAYTAVAGDGVMVDTDSAAITITLPASASLGDFVRIMDVTGNCATAGRNITVGRAGHNIQGAAADLTIATNRAAIGLVYANATEGWVLIEN